MFSERTSLARKSRERTWRSRPGLARYRQGQDHITWQGLATLVNASEITVLLILTTSSFHSQEVSPWTGFVLELGVDIMKASTSSLFRSLASKIHPPLPLNPRESQKLLTLLNSSFRHQLNKEHPHEDAKKANPTSGHVQHILSSPLFRGTNTEKGRSRAKSGSHDFVGNIQESLVNPMDFFQARVAAGEATMDLACRCLRVQRQNNTVYQDAITSKQSCHQPSVVQPILHWLWACGLEDSMEFIYDSDFSRELIIAMVAENRDRQIQGWLDRIVTMMATSNTSSDALLPDIFGRTVYRYQNSLINVRGSTSGALEVVTSALNRLKPQVLATNLPALKCSVYSLVDHIVSDNTETLGTALFDDFTITIEHTCFNRPFIKACLALCHPEHPDPLPAFSAILQQRPGFRPSYTVRGKKVFEAICLRTTGAFVESGCEKEARQLVEFVQKLPSPQPPTESAKSHTNSDKNTVEPEQGSHPLLAV